MQTITTTTNSLKEITSNQTLVREDKIIEVNLIRKDINTRDVIIPIIILTMLTQDNLIEPMEKIREDNTIMKIKMKAILKATMEDQEHKVAHNKRLIINLEIKARIIKGIKSDLEEIKVIMITMNIREFPLSTARLRH